MKVIVPYAKLHDAVPRALQSQGIEAQYVDTSASDRAYFDLLSRLWDEEETFVIVEGDIVPWPGAVKGLLACGEMWCANPYAIFKWYSGCLGFSKFGKELIDLTPDLFRVIEQSPDILFTRAADDSPPEQWSSDGIWVSAMSWRRLDGVINLLLMEAGLARHLHYPPVTHLHAEMHSPGLAADESIGGKEYEDATSQGVGDPFRGRGYQG
jgi:hypothetical protein